MSRAALAAVVLSAAACTASGPKSETPPLGEVRIGVLAPRSGASRAAGTEAQRGAELAADLVNGEQGPAPLAGTSALARRGGHLTVIGADTRSNPDRAASEAVRLVAEQHVAGLVGAYDVGVTEVASQRTERLRVPFVNGDTSADYLTQRGLDWFFRTGPTDRMFGEAFFSALGELDSRTRQIAVLYTNDQRGNVIADLTEELASEGGFQSVAKVPLQADGDPVAAVQALRSKAPGGIPVFVVASTPAAGTALLKAIRQTGYTPPGIFAFGPGFLETGVLADATDAEGLFASTAWSREVAGRSPVAKPVMELYEDRYGAPMGEVAAGSFTAVLVLAEAIGQAGSTDPQRVRAALLNLDIPGREMIMPWSGMRFDTSHQNTDAAGVVEQRVKGLFRVVFPDELQPQEAAVWPLSDLRKG